MHILLLFSTPYVNSVFGQFKTSSELVFEHFKPVLENYSVAFEEYLIRIWVILNES